MNKLENYNPEYKSLNDAIAFAVHLAFLNSNCKLIGLNENQYLEDMGSIPQGWNKSNEMYAFRYVMKDENQEKKQNKNDNKDNNKNDKANDKDNDKDEKKQDDVGAQPQGSCYLVKIMSLGNGLIMASAVKQGTNNIATLDITLSDHLSVNSKQLAKDKKILSNFGKLYRNLNALLLLIQDSIVDKVIEKADKKNDKNEKDKEKDKKNDKNPLLIDDNNNNRRPLGQPMRPGIGGIGGIGGMGGIGGIGGDFGGDLNPFGGGGGGLMGQGHGRFQNIRPNGGNNNGNQGNLPGARFDPFGPGPLGGQQGPDPDHMQRPGRNQDWIGGGGLGGFGGNRRGGGGGGFGGGGFGGFV